MRERGVEPPPPKRGLAPEASASAIPPLARLARLAQAPLAVGIARAPDAAVLGYRLCLATTRAAQLRLAWFWRAECAEPSASQTAVCSAAAVVNPTSALA